MQMNVTKRLWWISLRGQSVLKAVLTVLMVSLVLPHGAFASAPRRALVLDQYGLSTVHLGTSESSAYMKMSHFLGHPTTPITSTPALELCGVDAMASWHAFSLYFNHQRLVGISLGPGKGPSGETTRGLRLGDTLERARAIYGASLRTSANNGGAWFVAIGTRRLDGFLSPSSSRIPSPTSRILTIDVGAVGCPAMSP